QRRGGGEARRQRVHQAGPAAGRERQPPGAGGAAVVELVTAAPPYVAPVPSAGDGPWTPPPPPPRSPAARGAWTAVGLAVAVGAIGVWVPLFVINQFSTSHAPLPPTRQVITTDVSAVTVERGSGSGAVVTSSGYRGQRTPTNHVRVSGHTLTVRSSCASGLRLGWCTRNYVLEVPARTAVTAHLGTGAVEVSGVDGPLDLQRDDGSHRVTRTTRAVHASSGTGRVTVKHVDGAVDAASQDGEVQVAKASETVRATSGTGSVTLSGLTGPSVDAHSNDGRVTVG